MNYIVKNEHFEGPLDLLLNLIEEQKLDITQFSLAAITEEYLEHVKSQEMISLENLAAFLNVAAKLILIKSKALLPLLKMDDDEEEDMKELERQLLALRAIKDVVPDFINAQETAAASYGRTGFWGVSVQFVPQEGLTGDDLARHFRGALGSIPQLDKIEEKIVSDVISLEKRISEIQIAVQKRAKVAFSEIIKESESTQEVVVSFLALLELVKQKLLTVEQDGAFKDIQLHRKERENV